MKTVCHNMFENAGSWLCSAAIPRTRDGAFPVVVVVAVIALRSCFTS